MQHRYHTCDDAQRGGRDLQPSVEAGDELCANVFAWVGFEVVEGAFEDILFLSAPAERDAADEVFAYALEWVRG